MLPRRATSAPEPLAEDSTPDLLESLSHLSRSQGQQVLIRDRDRAAASVLETDRRGRYLDLQPAVDGADLEHLPAAQPELLAKRLRHNDSTGRVDGGLTRREYR